MSIQQETAEPRKSIYERINNEFVEKHLAMHRERLKKEAEEEKKAAEKNKENVHDEE
jgi:hypothetical protein